MIYLFNQTEKLIDVIDEASLADFTHTIELNQFDRANFEIPVDYKPNIIKEAQFFGFQSRDRAFCLFRISEKYYDIGLTIQGIDRAESDLHSFIIEDKRPGETASDVLREILKGTGYQLGDIDGLTINGNMSFYYISVRQALVKLIESYACEFRVRYTFVENKIIGRYIDLNQRFGRKTGHQFEYGSNILNIIYEESSDEVVTALIGRGKGEQSTDESGEATGGYGRRIQFKDVSWSVAKGDPVDKPAGQNYVANETARNIYGLHQNGVIKHRFGVYTNEDIEDPVELLKATYKELQRLSIPIVTFKANLLDLANAIEQDVWIGDSVGIVRDQIGIAFEARIHKLIIDKLDDNRSVVELGDYQTLQAKDRSTRQQAIKDAVSGFSEGLIEEAIANEVERRNKEFDEKIRVNKLEFDNELKRAKERAEEIKRQITDEIDKKFQSFDNTSIQEAKRRAEEALRNAGASTLLAQEAKRIGLDSVAKLEEFKRQATSAQTALLGDLDVLKRTIANDIRPKQAQAEAEISKQVEALVQTKKELAGVKSAQSTFEQSTTRRLSELTNLANGKASKSELTQTAEELTSKIASVQVAHRNQGDRVSAIESNFKQRADALDAGVRSLTEGLRTKADISALNVTAENIRQSVKSLETDTQNKLNQKLSQAEFEVQAGSIRQEILNATKDKADKTLVVAEAGKLREEFSKMKVGSRNYAEDYDFSRGLWYYSQGDNSPQDWIILDGEYNVKGTTNTWKQMQIQSKEGSRSSWKGSTSLLDLEVGETYTLSFQGICYSGSSSVWLSLRANRTAPSNPEIMYGNFNLTSSWQTYQVTIPALTKPENFDFWRIILGYNEIGHVAFRKVELTRSSTRIDAGPAPEDGKTDLVVAKSEFQKTADGLSAKLATVENYVGQDGQRQEALRRYTREESAKQATSVRELVTRDYVGKSAYQEDVRGIERRLEAITNPQNGSIATQIAKYKTAVDGRFADITSMIAGKANQVDFQRVRETSQLYERILGNTENGIADKVARMAMTNQLFQVEVGKAFADHQNLFLTSTLTKGFLGNNGIIYVANATQKEVTSDFISVDPNEKIIFQHWVTLPENGMAWTAWQFFDKNKNPIDNRKPGLNAYKTTVGKQHNINQITVPANAYFVRFSARMYDDGLIKVEKGSAPSDYSVAPNDALEAVKTVQRQLDGSWAVQNINGVGSIVSQINATNNQILIEAEKIRLKGKTLLDELTAIQGYFKRLFVGDASVGTLNSDIIRSNSITADKLVMDMAMARRFVSSDIFTDTLAAKEAFINKLRSVVVTATFLEGFQGKIGGFRFGQYTNRNGYFITGINSVSIGMGNGMNAGANRNAFWANWGESLDTPGPKAWYVNTDGTMYCRNEASFYSKVDFASTSKVNFYSRVNAEKGLWLASDDVFGEGNNPVGGYNRVVWWSQIVTGKFRQHAGITTGSDRKLKENIEPTPVNALDKINALNLVAFDYIKDKTHEEIGLIAQEVLNIIPGSVEKYEGEDNHLTINYSKFVPYLIKAIQELNQKIEKMEKTIA
ncbi:phage tail spike protein [Streptococcus mitis]|uniref:phage tail spike protein n=1 Tax=Streptococcus mitis TaxID=28037 RepID=UPI0025532C1E|nr:phage tail spike protein [Streptococcus mitis]MDK6637261.1 phage tail spike protein [Streptococcus mitis]MDK7133801.1 phage tail spike protein [Streptococcus mitis]